MNNKYFIITIDTEADNQWDNTKECTTENAKYLPRFQELAEKYDFKPIWLTTYEMAENDSFVKYFKNKQDNDLCEIGMHIHAWNTPPFEKIEHKTNERSFITEYSNDIIKKKIESIDSILTKRFNKKPVSTRSGRWATNKEYFDLLISQGYKVDCSFTPHVNWKNSLGETGVSGNDYRNASEKGFFIGDTLLELPMTIRKIHSCRKDKMVNIKGFLKETFHFIKGKNQWVRPDKSFYKNDIIKVINECNKKNDYIMFMIHSSELMPGGSPNFKTKEDIEKLYNVIEYIFSYVTKLGYRGITLRDFYERINND